MCYVVLFIDTLIRLSSVCLVVLFIDTLIPPPLQFASNHLIVRMSLFAMVSVAFLVIVQHGKTQCTLYTHKYLRD